jgi:Flp pilus assembly protein TadD
MMRVVMLGLLLTGVCLSAQEPKAEDLAKLPPYERMLKGDDAKKAEELQKSYNKYLNAEDWAEAKKFAQALIDFRTQKQGADHYEVTNANQLLKNVEIRAQLTPQERKALAEADQQNQQLVALDQQGQFVRAAQLGQRILTTRKKLLGENHPDYAESLNNLALLYDLMGDSAKAEPLYLQSREILKKVLGENHPLYATSLNNLAALYDSMGDSAKAEPIYVQSREIYKKVLGENHPLYATSLNNLALLYDSMGDSAKSEPLYLKAREIDKKLLGENHPDYARDLNNLALLYDSMGDSAKAEPIYVQSREIYKKVLGENHPLYATSLNNLALLYDSMGDSAKSEPLYLQAREIRKKVLGENHPSYATSLNNLAGLYQSMGNYAKAEPLLVECTRSYEMSRIARASGFQRAFGGAGQNPFSYLATVSARLNKPRQGYEMMERNLARAFLDVQAERRGQTLTPDQQARRTRIVNELSPIEKRISVLVNRAKLIDEETKELSEKIASRSQLNVQLADLAAELSTQEVSDFAAIQKAIPNGASLLTWVDAVGGSGKGQTQEHWACVLTSSGEPIWVRLPGFGPSKEQASADNKLTSDLRYELAQSPQNQAKISELFEKVKAQRITPILKHLEGITTLYVVPVEQMAGIPVEPMLPDRTISYVPSGTFLARRDKPSQQPNSLLALGDPVFPKLPELKPSPTALPPNGLLITQVVPNGGADKANLKAGDVLVSYAGTQLNRVEELGKLVAENAMKKEVPLVFWREADDKVVPRDIAPGKLGVLLDKEPAREAIASKRKNDVMMATLTRGDEWAELPGTSLEVAELKKLFGDAGNKYLTRSDASEQTLDAMRKKDELKNFKYLHIATHGKTDNYIAFNSKIVLSQDRPKALLAAAGEPLLDNQLLAREVLDHWKLNADMVTLSACETGLGKQGGGDGLLGFAQSFLLAGSRSVCLSLWKVDDTATALLMDRFYRNLLEKKMTKAEALHESKNWLKNLSVTEATDRLGVLAEGVSRGGKTARDVVSALPKDTTKPFEHPKYWAAFILIGSPD